MMYKTKVTIISGAGVYPPDSLLPEMNREEIAFLKRNGYIELAEGPEEETQEDASFFDGGEAVRKTKEEILKIRSKKALKEYADLIGCDLGEDYEKFPLEELKDAVLNFMEETEADGV